MSITNTDLINNKHKYSVKELTQNVDHLLPNYLLYTQTLNEEFCAKYILDRRWDTSGDEDADAYCEPHILHWQPHLNPELFYAWIDKLYGQK